MSSEAIARRLWSRRLPSGLWSWSLTQQAAVEPTCFAYLALRSDPLYAPRLNPDPLSDMQLPDGGWPAFSGDTESSWTTALAVSALGLSENEASARSKGIHWLLGTRGREAHWLWKWKFKWIQRAAPIDPEKFGWPWLPGAASWVIPTALSVVVLKQWTNCAPDRAATARAEAGISMLLARRCVAGGWNAGNNIVYGSALPPHVETTAAALLALQGRPAADTATSIDWLLRAADRQTSIESLSLSVLALFLFGHSIRAFQAKLSNRIDGLENGADNFTLALALLALRCGESIHPFEVLA